MRKHDVRKWIHAICDLLPLLVIPVFALGVRSDNGVTPIEVQQEQNIVVNFNQLIDNGNMVSTEYYIANNGVLSAEDNVLTYTYSSNNKAYYNYGISRFFTFEYQHIYLFKFSYSTNFGASGSKVIVSDLGYPNLEYSFNASTTFQTFDFLVNSNVSSLSKRVRFCNITEPDDNDYINLMNFQVFDLTLMFGSGNEPSINQFNIWYSSSFYSYDTGTKQLLNTGIYQTYNDTDVGSQMVYTLYNTVDKYFNFDKVFNFNKIYEWLEINVFNGTAPLGAYIVWNVFLYEFLMDLMFLLYALFMFFIDMCTNLIDRFTCQASGGRLK